MAGAVAVARGKSEGSARAPANGNPTRRPAVHISRNAVLAELGLPCPTSPRIGRGRAAFKREDERKIPPPSAARQSEAHCVSRSLAQLVCDRESLAAARQTESVLRKTHSRIASRSAAFGGSDATGRLERRARTVAWASFTNVARPNAGRLGIPRSLRRASDR